MHEWKVLTGRITFLPDHQMFPPGLSALGLYRGIWELDPDNFQKSANPLQMSVAQGNVGGLRVVCVAGINRVDINFGPDLPEGADTPPVIRLIEDADQLDAALKRTIEAIGTPQLSLSSGRVAVAIQFARLEETLTTANQALTSTIPSPYKIKLTDEDDFVFQVNTPFSSAAVPNVKLNLVRNWSVVRFQVVGIAVAATVGSPSGGLPSIVPNLVTPAIGASVNVEVNNAPHDRSLEFSEQTAILTEGLTKIGDSQTELGLHVEGFANAR